MRDERRDIRLLLETLTPEQWEHPSLCRDWTVRDLVAHLVGWDDLLLYRSRWEHVRVWLRYTGVAVTSGTMINRRIQWRTRRLTVEDLLRRFGADDAADLRWLFDGTNTGAHLAEYVIHHQDIRRPLGLPREIPLDRLVAALDSVLKLPGVRAPAGWKLLRHRWEATDVDWFRGRGPLVRAPAEEILLTLAGRLG
jgi:uncharacterized protein (TIGR03083 family)